MCSQPRWYNFSNLPYIYIIRIHYCLQTSKMNFLTSSLNILVLLVYKIKVYVLIQSCQFHNVKRCPKQRKTVGSGNASRRILTYSYMLNDANGLKHQVCKSFFLLTLGYKAKNAKPIMTALRTSGSARDKRGVHRPSNKIDRYAYIIAGAKWITSENFCIFPLPNHSRENNITCSLIHYY